MKRKLFSRISLAALLAGVAVGGYALVRIFILRATLPPGTCPVVNYSGYIYAGIALCAISFVFSLLEQRVKKSQPDADKEDGAE